MNKHILIPVALDHEGVVQHKIATARHLLGEGGRIALLTMLEEIPGFLAELFDGDQMIHLSKRIKSKLQDVAAEAHDVECAVLKGKAGKKAIEYASIKNWSTLLSSVRTNRAFKTIFSDRRHRGLCVLQLARPSSCDEEHSGT